MIRVGHDGMYQLQDKASGEPVNEGDVVYTFRGERDTLIDGAAPYKHSSTGKVQLQGELGEYYAGVIDAEWVRV